jgi:hypothetical protein
VTTARSTVPTRPSTRTVRHTTIKRPVITSKSNQTGAVPLHEQK